MDVAGFFKQANELGIWDFISVLALIPAFGIAAYLLWPARRIQQLNFHISRRRDADDWPLKIAIEIRNQTNRPYYIHGVEVQFTGLKGHPLGSRNTATGHYECKFHNQAGQQLESDIFLRPKESTWTWVPLDPNQTNEIVDAALVENRAGVITCNCVGLGETIRMRKLKQDLRT
jgi:hypothetical protein